MDNAATPACCRRCDTEANNAARAVLSIVTKVRRQRDLICYFSNAARRLDEATGREAAKLITRIRYS
eukprot:scaffold102898_cov35-Attheya_sp.AAC.2